MLEIPSTARKVCATQKGQETWRAATPRLIARPGDRQPGMEDTSCLHAKPDLVFRLEGKYSLSIRYSP